MEPHFKRLGCDTYLGITHPKGPVHLFGEGGLSFVLTCLGAHTLALVSQMELGAKQRVRMLNLLTRRQGEEEELWQQQHNQVPYLRERLAEVGY